MLIILCCVLGIIKLIRKDQEKMLRKSHVSNRGSKLEINATSESEPNVSDVEDHDTVAHKRGRSEAGAVGRASSHKKLRKTSNKDSKKQ